jgi:hypothetical protein
VKRHNILAQVKGAPLSRAEQQQWALLAISKDGVGVILRQGIGKMGPVDFLRTRGLTMVSLGIPRIRHFNNWPKSS